MQTLVELLLKSGCLKMAKNHKVLQQNFLLQFGISEADRKTVFKTQKENSKTTPPEDQGPMSLL